MIGYVAKDKDEEVYLHLEEPSYDYELEGWYSSSEIINITREIIAIGFFFNLKKYDNTL